MMLAPDMSGNMDKQALYERIRLQAEALVDGERDLIANTANVSALLYQSLPDINWAGVYLLKDGELVVGPFQGKPACIRIAMGKGVCGIAAERRETLVVEDVNQFDGHIFCDPDSRSEIVVPLIAGDELIGVLDIDSAHTGRFDDDDRRGLEAVAEVILDS